ncbi:MAG: hydrogenase 4 subunit F [Elusimicrobia bacterium]|nr:hydrogenase 4 subunit F [Elusimicrobiota bacterium]
MTFGPWLLVAAPALTAAACGLGRTPAGIHRAGLAGSVVTLAATLALTAKAAATGAVSSPGFHMDALSAFVAVVVSLLSAAASASSFAFVEHDAGEVGFGINSWRVYYGLLHLFTAAMLFVTVTSNLGFMWIAVEATTLSSAFLVGFHRRRDSIEAAWKYVILCSVGIAFALLGTVILYEAGLRAGNGHGLDWTSFAALAPRMDPGLVRLAFLFAAIGYGTKAGLAPMHTWLPDAHSQAPSPVSALLSGALLKCSIYAVLRFHIVASGCLGPGFSSKFFLGFGLASLLVAVPFILAQRNFKRLLAYSSIEHVGIISVGFGFGGVWGTYGALLHMLNHALAKSLLFLSAGNISLRYGSKRLHHVEGALAVLPATGPLFLAAALALAGVPPFSLFVSEFMIVVSGFQSGHLLASVVFLAAVALAFAGILYHSGTVAMGVPRKTLAPAEPNPASLAPMALLLLGLLALGVWMPGPLDAILRQCAAIVQGGSHG